MVFDIQWIRDNKTLEAYCQQWQRLPFITLDTEFFRETTFYPIAGLIQVGDGQGTFLVDPLCISEWSALGDLLKNKQVVKVLHASSEDIEVLFQLTKATIQPLFDTQLAAAFSGLGLTLGYSTLVKQLLNIEINKEKKRSDWLKRPLLEEQEHYAGADVFYLAMLYRYFADHLPAYKIDWLYADTEDLVRRYTQVADPQLLYKDIRQAWRLTSQQLGVLKALCVWREQEAMVGNIARRRLMRDNALFLIAQKLPKTLNELSKIAEIHPSVIRKYGDTLLVVIQEVLIQPATEWPLRVPKPLPSKCAKLSNRLKELIRCKAVELGICPELLWRKKVIEALLRTGFERQEDYSLPDSLEGWRRSLLGTPFLKVLNEE